MDATLSQFALRSGIAFLFLLLMCGGPPFRSKYVFFEDPTSSAAKLTGDPTGYMCIYIGLHVVCVRLIFVQDQTQGIPLGALGRRMVQKGRFWRVVAQQKSKGYA